MRTTAFKEAFEKAGYTDPEETWPSGPLRNIVLQAMQAHPSNTHAAPMTTECPEPSP
jgi:hypothetical protein